jgi:hydroxymethylpyrimidine pyrophosphatase-like HAD family hydrolase
MPILTLACDYDGTLAIHGQITAPTWQALLRFKNSGGRVILVTGRELGDLLQVCPQIRIFDFVVAENGALLYDPATLQTRSLADPPAQGFLERLRARRVQPLAPGRVIVATVQKHLDAVSSTIREMGLELDIIFNRESLMILPRGLNKATGLKLALEELAIPARSVVGVGDAENDSAFLEVCGYAVAVANAIPSIQQSADMVTVHDHGAGVEELIGKIIAGELDRVQAGPY